MSRACPSIERVAGPSYRCLRESLDARSPCESRLAPGENTRTLLPDD